MIKLALRIREPVCCKKNVPDTDQENFEFQRVIVSVFPFNCVANCVNGEVAGPFKTRPDGSNWDPWQLQVKRLFPKVQLVVQPSWVQTAVNAVKESLTFTTRVLAFSIKSQFPEVFRRVWIVRSIVIVLPEITIPLAEPPGGLGFMGSASSVEEHAVKKAAPNVLNTTETPACSRNFLRESIKLPDSVVIKFSMAD